MKKYSIVALLFVTAFLASCSTPDNTEVEVTPTTVVDDMSSDDMAMDDMAMDDMDDMGDMWDDIMDQTPMEEGVEVGGAMMVESKDIVENAMESSDHTTLVAAVQAADLVETLQSEGPFTVFAPTNAAFSALPAWTVDDLLLEENVDQLTNILTYHVVPGIYESSDLTDGTTLSTVQGETLEVTVSDGMVMINGTPIEIADARSSNWVTHVIGAVLMPSN